jgi:hypothetical protein
MRRRRIVLASLLLLVIVAGFVAYQYLRNNRSALSPQVVAVDRLPKASEPQAATTYRSFRTNRILATFLTDATTSETLTSQAQCKAMAKRLATLGSPAVVLDRVGALPDGVVVSFANAIVKQEIVTLEACLSGSKDLHAAEGRLRNDVNYLSVRLQEDHADA